MGWPWEKLKPAFVRTILVSESIPFVAGTTRAWSIYPAQAHTCCTDHPRLFRSYSERWLLHTELFWWYSIFNLVWGKSPAKSRLLLRRGSSKMRNCMRRHSILDLFESWNPESRVHANRQMFANTVHFRTCMPTRGQRTWSTQQRGTTKEERRTMSHSYYIGSANRCNNGGLSSQ